MNAPGFIVNALLRRQVRREPPKGPANFQELVADFKERGLLGPGIAVNSGKRTKLPVGTSNHARGLAIDIPADLFNPLTNAKMAMHYAKMLRTGPDWAGWYGTKYLGKEKPIFLQDIDGYFDQCPIDLLAPPVSDEGHFALRYVEARMVEAAMGWAHGVIWPAHGQDLRPPWHPRDDSLTNALRQATAEEESPYEPFETENEQAPA